MPDAERAVLIEAATEGLQRSLGRIRESMSSNMRTTFAEWLNSTLAMFKAERLGGEPGVRRRTGTLARSWYTTIEGEGLEQVGVIGSRAPYAKVLEYGTGMLPGGQIVPKQARMLAIPIEGGPAVTPAGVYRLGAGRLRDVLPAAFPDVSFFTAGSGERLVLMGRAGEAEAQPWFVLTRSVKFGPKLGLTDTVKKYLGVLTRAFAKNAKDAGCE